MSQVSQGRAGRMPIRQVLVLPSGCVSGLSEELSLSHCLPHKLVTH